MDATNVDNDDVMIGLESSDGETIVVSKEIMMISKTVSESLIDMYDLVESSRDTGVPFPFPVSDVDGETLKKVVEYCTIAFGKPVPDEVVEKTYPLPTDDLTDWEREYVDNASIDTLLKLGMAANYLEIMPLLQLSLKPIASMINGKKALEIRKAFGMPNDLDESEVALIENGQPLPPLKG